MDQVWIRDENGRLLGPLGFELVQDLIAQGRLRGAVELSWDGSHWAPASEFPELGALLQRQGGASARARQLQEAARLAEQLKAMQGKPFTSLFGLPADAPIETIRACFFRLVKQFYPDRLPPDAPPELRRVSQEIFTFLSQTMATIERRAPARGPATPPPLPGARRTPPPAATPVRPARGIGPPPPPSPPPRYDPSEFIGISFTPDKRAVATVEITPQSCSIFTEDKLLNIAAGGAFIPTRDPIELGTRIELTFDFKDEPRRRICARGRVVSWFAGDGKGRRGFGVQFVRIDRKDLDFIKSYVARHSPGPH